MVSYSIEVMRPRASWRRRRRRFFSIQMTLVHLTRPSQSRSAQADVPSHATRTAPPATEAHSHALDREALRTSHLEVAVPLVEARRFQGEGGHTPPARTRDRSAASSSRPPHPARRLSSRTQTMAIPAHVPHVQPLSPATSPPAASATRTVSSRWSPVPEAVVLWASSSSLSRWSRAGSAPPVVRRGSLSYGARSHGHTGTRAACGRASSRWSCGLPARAGLRHDERASQA